MQIKHTIILLITAIICYGDEETTTELLCDDNISCVTDSNDSFTETTEMSFINETLNFTVIPTLKHEIDYDLKNLNKDECLCDLQNTYCNINCCCDKDCSYSQKLVFSECEHKIIQIDRNYCNTKESVYINKTIFERAFIENSLFCIVKSNLPKHHIIQISQPIVSINKAQQYISSRYKWGESTRLNGIEENDTQSTFKYGDKIWINSNSEFIPLYVCDNFLSSACVRKKYVLYLKNIKTQCSQSQIEESNKALSARTYFENITVLSKSNFSSVDNYLEDAELLSFTAFICDDYLENCEEIQSNDTRLKIDCKTKIFSGEISCLFLTQKIKYIFYHNGTNGLTSAEVYFSQKNISYFISDAVEFIQNFDVIFFWSDYTNDCNFSASLSGNPGYIIGKPIRFGILNEVSKIHNNSIKITKLEIDQNDFDATKNILTLPRNVNGYCKFNNQTYNQVDFGFNMRLECVQRMISNSNLNATDICINIQKQILQLWQIEVNKNLTESYKYIGMFGNSNKNTIAEWIQIIYKFDEAKLFEQISGKIENQYLICLNMAQTLKINIIYVYINYEHIQNQAKILNTFYDLETSKKLNINYNKDFKFITSDLNLVMEVMFFDVTVQKMKKYVDLPTLQIKLPYDFFYPFTFSGHSVLTYNYYLIVFCMYLYFNI